MAETKYISCTDTAKLIRKELKAGWPSVKFSVRSHTYAGGASIDISWPDGPRQEEVEPTAKRFEGADFDAMVDLKTNKSHWIGPDGTVTLAHADEKWGTAGPTDNPAPAGARRVSFMADYVFCHRKVSNIEELATLCRDYIREHCKTEGEGTNERFGGRWVEQLGYRMAHDRAEGEDWAAPFARVVLLAS